MKATLVGRQKVDYVSNRTGKQVRGVSLYLTREEKNSNIPVEGLVAESLYIGSNSMVYEDVLKFPIGSILVVSYNNRGYVDDIWLDTIKK